MSPLLAAGVLLLVFPPSGAAQSARFDQANRQFAAGDYAAAAAAYEQVLAADGPRAAVYYDLGNSYQRLGRTGPAILAYERARLLTPRDPDLLANLALARKAAAAFEDGGRHPLVEVALTYLSRNEWSWLVTGSALVLGALALVAGVLRRGPRLAALVTAGLAGVALALGGSALYLRRGEANQGIVLSDAATVRLSPFATAEALGTPGPGRIVRLGGKTGDYYFLEVPGVNLRGWMALKDVAAITPEPAGNRP